MPQSLSCPSCHAPLDYDDGDGLVVKCQFCNQSVSLAEPLGQHTPPPATPFTPAPPVTPIAFHASPQQVKRGFGCSIAIFALTFLAPVVIIGLVLFGVFRTVSNELGDIQLPEEGSGDFSTFFGTPEPANTPLPTPTATPGFASQVLSFGSEGIGVGLFDDARTIASDGSQYVFVANREGGRVQVFDFSGNYVTEWQINPDTFVKDIASSRDGTVYVIEGIDLYHYTAMGEPLGQIVYNSSNPVHFESITVGLDGNFVAIVDIFATENAIMKFDPAGNLIWKTITDDLPNIPFNGLQSSNAVIALDAQGIIYIATENEEDNHVIYRLSADGQYLNFINGGDGSRNCEDERGLSISCPGEFDRVRALAVDGWGRLYVSGRVVQVLTPQGHFIDLIENNGDDLVFNDQNQLFFMKRDHVEVMTVTPPEN